MQASWARDFHLMTCTESGHSQAGGAEFARLLAATPDLLTLQAPLAERLKCSDDQFPLLELHVEKRKTHNEHSGIMGLIQGHGRVAALRSAIIIYNVGVLGPPPPPGTQ